MSVAPTQPIVSCRNVTKTYKLGAIEVPALNGVDLDLMPGDFATLAGPSGSGKSTLLNLIGGLDQATTGDVTVDGQRLGGLNKSAMTDLRLHHIGFVFQAYNLIPVLSALENIELILQLRGVAPGERDAAAMQALEDVGLAGLEHRRPANLSGGEQQRVAVARALIGGPSIILADEPTANLDSKTAADLIALMARLNAESGVTFLIGTHDTRVIAHAKRRIQMIDGRIESDSDIEGESDAA